MLWPLIFATALADKPKLKLLVMPLTPSEHDIDAYHALIPFEGAESRSWRADAPGFTCVGAGDFVEVRVERATWPSQVPKHVYCADGEETTVKTKVWVKDFHHVPMFTPDGTLVLPREKKTSAIFKGVPPRLDFGVQPGRTGNLELSCKIERGPTLEVVAGAAVPDGMGRCTLMTTIGEKIPIPVVIRTIKRWDY